MSAGRIPHLDLGPVAAFGGTIVLPGSKSISNRTLLLAGLAEGGTELKGVLASDDTERMLDALNALGVPWIRKPDSDDYLIQGAGGYFPIKQADLFMGNAGTAIRPLTAVLALGGGHYKLSGVPRMHERPIGDLVDALRQLGADIRYNGKEGYPPLELVRAEIQVPEVISVRGDVSSQFLTALLLALPLTGQGARVEVVGELISKPYVEITLNMMRRFGVEVEREGWQVFRIPAGQQYRSPGQLHVEGDASSASYFLAAAAIKGGPVRIEGIGRDSIQGDVRFAEVVEQMGAEVKLGDGFIEVQGKGLPLQAIDADLNHIPDAAMTAAVMALFADGPSTLRNIASWRVKETDRLSAMATELRKVGAEVEEGPDFLRIVPPRELRGATIDTYDDHRMAMCFSLVALGGVAVRINDPECVNKTFPEYFSEFERLAQR